MSALPPPPSGGGGAGPPADPIPLPPPPDTHRVDWRRVSFGWVVLHIVIALVIGIAVQTAIVGLTSAVAHVDAATIGETKNQDVDTAGGVSFLLALAGSLIGWLLFVYLRASTLVRATVLVVSLVVPLAIGVTLLTNALPSN